MKNLSYWIFTSGEKGIHGLDWGIKYASPILTNRSSLDVSYRALDVKYRALLEEFSLTPRLSRPDDDKAGLLLLPGENNSALLGFIFPSTDHQQRPNTSTVVCVVPEDLKQTMNVSEAVRCIWCNNDIECIAQQNSSERPDFLQFYEDSAAVTKATKILNFNSQLKWPGENDGYIQINERITKLARPIPRMPLRKIVITLSGLIVVIIGAIFTTHALRYRKVEVPPASMILISPDITSSDKKLPQPLPESIVKTVSSGIALKREEPATTTTQEIKDSDDEVPSSGLRTQETPNGKSTDDEQKKIDEKVSQILAELSGQELGAIKSFDIVPINNIEVSSDFGVLCPQVMDSDMIKDELSKLVNLNMVNTSKKGEVTFYWRKTAESKESIKKFLSRLKNESLLSVENLKPIQNESALSKGNIKDKIAQNLSLKISEKFAVRFFFQTEKDNLYLVYVVKCNSNSMTTERYIATKIKGFVPIKKGTDPFNVERIYTGVGLKFKISDSREKTLDAYLNQFDMRRKFQ